MAGADLGQSGEPVRAAGGQPAGAAAGNIIRVGTRASSLARRQTDEVLALLRPHYPALDFQVIPVTTHGDAHAAAPLAGMGLGVFVREIEQQLLSGQLDLAVHSLKDLPTRLPAGLTLGALPARADPRDALVNIWNCPLAQLPAGARIGTSSPRRQAQLLRQRPDLTVVPLRGSVETRLRKAGGDECDGAILAAAGLRRLGLESAIAEYLSPQQFVPPPGQGVLAVEIRAEDERLGEMLRAIEDMPTRYAATAERAFLELLGGGCQLPVGAYAEVDGGRLELTAFLGTADGRQAAQASVHGLADNPRQLAAAARQALLEQDGGRELVGMLSQSQGDAG